MPHLVQMQKKYGKDGLVILSVQLDSLEEKNLKEQVAKILKSKGADFTTVILNLDQDAWQKKLGATAYPFVFVFDREGKWIRFVSDDPKYKKPEDMLQAIDKLVETLVAKK
jgi:hypothetical protein